MDKKVLWIMAALLLVAPALQAGLVQDQLGGPAWLTYGGDVRLREVGFNNIITWNDDIKADQQHFFRLRTRLFAGAAPIDELSSYVRFCNEWRYYAKPKNNKHPLYKEVIMDNAWVRLQGLGDIPLQVKAGRQDILFQYGEGFLLMDGTPNDGSRSFYVDGLIASITVDEPNKVDLIAFYNSQEQPFGIDINDDFYQDDQPIGLYGVYWTNTKDLIADQKIEGYYLFKDGREASWATLPENQVHVVGTRFSGPITEYLSYAGELTGQFGEYDSEDQQAYGGYLRGTYKIPDCPLGTAVSLEGVYLSGDDPDSSKHEGWDPILARWPKWSELYIYSLLTDPVAGSGNHIAYWSNMEIYRAKVSVKPIERMTVDLVYQYLRAPEATGSGTGKDRGQNPQLVVKYAFNNWLSGHLWGEYFIPGDYYAGDDDGFFARWEMTAKF